MALSTQLVGTIWPMKWNRRSPGQPSPAPRRALVGVHAGRAAGPALGGVPTIAASPGFGGGVTCACADIGPLNIGAPRPCKARPPSREDGNAPSTLDGTFTAHPIRFGRPEAASALTAA